MEEAMAVLPDVLKPGLKIVFCGTAVGPTSARMGAYYAGRGNKFWPILFETNLTPYILDPREYQTLPKYGVGLTDLIKSQFGTDGNIKRATKEDIMSFRSKIEKYQPKAVAFNGKKAAAWFYKLKSTREVDYGRQPEDIGLTAVFVLPSTSAASGHWDEAPWSELEELVG